MTTDSPSEAREWLKRAFLQAGIHAENVGFLPDERLAETLADIALDALLACEGTGKRPALIEELAGLEHIGWRYAPDDHSWFMWGSVEPPTTGFRSERLYRRIDQSTREDA